MKMYIFLLMFLISINSFSSIWDAENEWDETWENEYSVWVKSKKVNNKMFSSKKSIYYGAWLDCADVTYALRAIFSFENKLPFKIKNPVGSRTKPFLTNEVELFDHVKKSNKRLVKFINYIGQSAGTENLVHNDSYSPLIATIRPGDFFMYKIKSKTGKSVRHSYNIVSITEQGSFNVIYGTQAKAKAKAPLGQKFNKTFTERPHMPWGFRRFLPPRYIDYDVDDYPEELSYSTEQFELIKELGRKKFFKLVTKKLKNANISVDKVLSTKLKNLCNEAIDRIKSVNEGIKYRKNIKKKCMNFSEYDAYSTPSRDRQLKDVYELLYDQYLDIVESRRSSEIDYDLHDLIKEIFHFKERRGNDLLKYCSINYRKGKTIDLRELLDRFNSDKVSFHPNDSINARWGEISKKTKCKKWYD